MQEITRFRLTVAEEAQLLGIGKQTAHRLTTYPYSDSV